MSLSTMFRAPANPFDELDGELVVCDVSEGRPARQPETLLAGVARGQELPRIDCKRYDLLLTSVAGAPRPWVFVQANELDAVIESLRAASCRNSVAAHVLAQVLRLGDSLSFADALLVESFAYSTLLGSKPFRTWLARRGKRAFQTSDRPRVYCERDNNVLSILLCNPERRNAFDARMRDELREALRIAEADPELRVELRAEGADFCSGGDLDEFGQTADLAMSHLIRVQHSVAGALHRLSNRTTSYVHGACIGAGIEFPAAAHLIADPDASFRLPELAMGLIPGAGGTASLPRRIGRQRLLYWTLSGMALDAQTALAWGLVDRVMAIS